MKKIKSTAVYSVTEESSEEGVLVQLEKRDEEGRLILEEKYYGDGTIESRIERTFNEKGLPQLQREFSGVSSAPDQETTYRYSAAGRLEEATIKYQDGSFTYRKFTHDEAANSETINIVDEDGEYEGKEFRKYDSEGRILAEVIHDDSGKLEEDVTREYDEHGLILSRITVFPDDYKTTEQFLYERNDQGLILHRRIVDEEEKLLRADEFDYDEKGNTIRHTAQDFNQGWAIVDEWTYNEDSKVIATKRSEPNGTVHQESDYEYNEQGLIQRQEKRTKHGVDLLLFKYEYFD